MARSKQGLRARVSQATGRGRKKPVSPIERAFDDVRQLVSDTTDRFFGESGQTKKKKSGAGGTRSGRQRQAEAKRAGASRIRSGQQKQAAAKKAARRRGAKTT